MWVTIPAFTKGSRLGWLGWVVLAELGTGAEGPGSAAMEDCETIAFMTAPFCVSGPPSADLAGPVLTMRETTGGNSRMQALTLFLVNWV